ncbi:hypothetical protein EG68_06829 [Paragonimus skrjabini miyazakii]|uniref:Uncharacterized protein n=1 Tax=Paragonimus skrjabini miyazakii TaxID=59628 RepID=A0A8S9YZE7_9TREM|nr:hypothetical protein EG68_06829 [Paragonimus skrjabini miyazakii]
MPRSVWRLNICTQAGASRNDSGQHPETSDYAIAKQYCRKTFYNNLRPVGSRWQSCSVRSCGKLRCQATFYD